MFYDVQTSEAKGIMLRAKSWLLSVENDLLNFNKIFQVIFLS